MIPQKLPAVTDLSVSSVETFTHCQEKWRRRYMEAEPEFSTPALILGKAVHAAEAHADHHQIDTGSRPTTEQNSEVLRDEIVYSLANEEVDLGESSEGKIIDTGVAVIGAYDEALEGIGFEPVKVEEGFKIQFDEAEWGFRGFIDVEAADGKLVDRKVIGRKLSEDAAATNLQPTAYMLAKREAGEPSTGFEYHTIIKTKVPKTEFLQAPRSDANLDDFVRHLMDTAAQINWCAENDIWLGAAASSPLCSSKTCGYWATCRYRGGAR
jgi:PD-(D/E)XK nuclease superfamily